MTQFFSANQVVTAPATFILLFGLVLFPSLNFAGDSVEVPGTTLATKPIGQETLGDVLTEMLDNNPSLQRRRSELEAAGYDLNAARWQRFPSLSADANTADGGNQQLVSRLEQSLWTGGRIQARIDTAKADQVVTSAALGETELDLLLRAVAVYYDILRLEQRLGIAKEDERELQRLADVVSRRAQAQVGAGAEEIQARARLQESRSQRIQIQRDLTSSRAELEQLIGRPLGQFKAPDAELAMPNLQLADWIRYALDYSPTLRRLEAEREAAAAQARQARSSTMPELFASYEYRSGDLEVGQRRDTTLLGLRYQPGAGLSSFSTARAAQSRAAAAVDALAEHEQERARDVEVLYSDVENLQLQIQPARLSLADLNEVFESYLRQFTVARKSWLDVLNTHRERVQAQIRLADIEWSRQSAKLRLMLLAGEVDINQLEQLR